MSRMKLKSLLALVPCFCLCACTTSAITGHAAGDSVHIEPPSEEDACFYDVGQTIEVKAIDKTDPGNSPLVSFTLDSCSVYSENLPEGVDLSEIPDYEVFRNGVGKDGSLPDGLNFIRADITYENKNDQDVSIGVNSIRLGFFGLDANATPPSYELCWVDGIETANAPKDAYMPTLPAHSTQSYSIGFMVSSDYVDNGNVRLLAQNEIRGLEQTNILGFNIPKES